MNLTWIDMQENQFTRKNHSKMLTDSLWNDGVRGCQCQNVIAVLVENGEMVDWDEQSYAPVHISKQTKDWLKKILIKVDGEWITRSPNEFNPQSEEAANISQLDAVYEIVDVDGEPREAHPCFDYSEHNWGDDVTEEKLPDGIYLVMLQTHCWSEVPYGYSYPEGDSEHEVALIKSVPIDFKGHFNGGIQREVDILEGEIE